MLVRNIGVGQNRDDCRSPGREIHKYVCLNNVCFAKQITATLSTEEEHNTLNGLPYQNSLCV